MHISMFVSTAYKRLLADICLISGVSLDVPDVITYDWAYIDGPKLDKSLLVYLEKGGEKPSSPEWLAPLMSKFFLTDEPNLLKCIRQVLVFCYKTEQLPTDEQLKCAQSAFEETETGVGIWSDCYLSNHDLIPTCSAARQIVGSVIYRINWSEITPSHGPGGVYPSRLPRDKSDFRTLYRPIMEKYPYDQYYCGMPTFWHDMMVHERYGCLTESDDIIAKLVAVPKDSRGPRIICVHPAESIWIQQGQRQLLEARITSHPLTRGKISFTDQTVNGKLALSSSQSREFVTLDLKEASDRVSSLLVRSLFGDYAYDWISCSRANKVKLLDGRVIELKKWAPMGNALCFPVESLVFFSLVTAGIWTTYGENCKDVYVFGDDIIYPRRFHNGVMKTLVRFGLIPNTDKTFVNGFFRESCGVDAYRGIDVTPLRLKKDGVKTLENLVSLTDLALRARLGGFEVLSRYLYSQVRRELWDRYRISMPISNLTTCGGFYEYQAIPFTEILLRSSSVVFHRTWHFWGARRWTVTGRQHVVEYGGWYHLQDSLLRLKRRESIASSEPSDRPTEYALPHSIQLTCGWLTYSLE